VRQLLVIALCLVLSASASGAAQQGAADLTGLGSTPLNNLGSVDASNATGPVTIDADNGIEWRRDKSIYIARGNAKAVRGGMSIAADTLTAHYRNGADGKSSVYLVEADGSVIVVSGDSTIVGDKAVYDLDKGFAVITGKNLKGTSKDSVITARDSLEYWTKMGAVVARGNAVASDPTHHVQADMLVGYYHIDPNTKQKKMYQVEATGHVAIENNGSVAHADKTVYALDSEIATLEGNVNITRGKNQLNGDHVVYNTKTGRARVTGSKGHVKTLLLPGSGGPAGSPLQP
jgi:lipopolysaccharide export system protein LptA